MTAARSHIRLVRAHWRTLCWINAPFAGPTGEESEACEECLARAQDLLARTSSRRPDSRGPSAGSRAGDGVAYPLPKRMLAEGRSLSGEGTRERVWRAGAREGAAE